MKNELLKKVRYLMMLPFFFTAITAALAQGLTVTGKVVDTDGLGLPGVTILVKGTSVGTATDMDGNYSINVPNGNATLVFNYVGYKSQEVAVNSRTSINVTMATDAKALDEVVVIGYGTAKRQDLTGAVTSMSAKEIETIPVADVAQAMTGRMAGVQVTTTDGAPGAEVVIRVRGGGSVTQDNSPLYIVDGFPVNSINDIAPADITSIDVLKDAASAAIYGSRGANGVVIITTKSAKSGKTSVSYNGYMQARTLPRKLDVLSPYEFVLAQYEYAKLRGGTDLTNFNRYFGVYEDLELYKRQKGTDWQEELYGDPALSQFHNLSITGGSDKTKMSLSVAHNQDEGILINSAYQRTYLNFKLNHEISKSLKLDLATRFSNEDVDGAGTSGSSSLRIGDGITTRPVNGLADYFDIDPNTSADAADDYDQFLRSIVSPTELALQDFRNRATKRLNMSTSLTWFILSNLSYRSDFGVDFSWREDKRFWGPLTGESRNVGGNLPLGQIQNFTNKKYRWTNTLNFTKTVNDVHSLDLLLGQEMIMGSGNSRFQRAKYFDAHLQPEVLFENMALGTPDRLETEVSTPDHLFSFFGRAQYQLKDKYLFNFTVRADGSSKFAPENRWGIFPAAAAAWRISQEDFMQDLSLVSDLKLRFSYGEAGNNRIQDNAYRRTYVISANRPIGFGEEPQPYYVPESTILTNPALKWETTVTRNLGLDFGLFKDRLSGSVDAYWNTTKDLLVEKPIPATTGYRSQQQNIGQTSNRGIELALNGSIIDKPDFTLSANFNVGINRSRVDDLGGVPSTSFQSNWIGTSLKNADDYLLNVGQNIGQMYGFVTDGFYTFDDFESYDFGAGTYSAGTYSLNEGVVDMQSFLGGMKVRPGVLKFKDLNGDGVITLEGDRKIIGNAMPKHTGGFGINSTFKGFDFSAFFNWVYGNDVYNTGRIEFNQIYRTSYGNMLNTVNYDNRFKYINASGELVTDLEELRALNANATIWSPFSMSTSGSVFHSDAVEDGSFLRLSNLTLGYSLPKGLISKVGMKQLRVYGTVYNAWLWTKYSGYDPEVTATRSSSYAALTPGVDYSAYPKSRTFTAGVNITF
ncbi:SusC/RagA family TonB-linked outer membrane protein [Botryobacter ruber]|uniref:SusC/RagA family TonB-linked outer membrane protein n=1 Tax=Botryobacter ruber TaxID=2171629 RepID=UPI0013E29759|nr:TonB-dependent receptor [Botryobacter ruber]